MGAMRVALASLSELDVPLWHGDRPTVLVNGYGHVYFETPEGVQTVKVICGSDLSSSPVLEITRVARSHPAQSFASSGPWPEATRVADLAPELSAALAIRIQRGKT